MSSSATGKAAILVVLARGEVDGFVRVLVEAGDAGSAAARARKTIWVLRDRSVALGLARRAKAYNTP